MQLPEVELFSVVYSCNCVYYQFISLMTKKSLDVNCILSYFSFRKKLKVGEYYP